MTAAPPFDPIAPPELPAHAIEPAVPRGADPESAIIGPIAGRYDLGERIARGGMGIVYRAHDRDLNRTVALKVMRGRYMDRPDLLRRFLAEARINGKLQHPGVVPVYQVGTLPDARPFIAMKLIEGQTLSRQLKDRKSQADNLAHFLKVFDGLCQAMAYAHRQGIIHRDLKPDNVMVGEFGEVQVMDWGLAKHLDPAAAIAPTPDGFSAVEKSHYLSANGDTPSGDHHLTQATKIHAVGPDDPAAGFTSAGEVFGTLPFMPPEQARGETDRVDRRGDVFSLGAILCQILTGQPPYFGSPERLREQARGAKLFGAFVLLDRCGADHALVMLTKHCLAVDPDARPADAGVLSSLVNDCLEGLQDRSRAIEVGRLKAEARLAEAEAREGLARRARRLAAMLAVAGVLVAGLLAAGLGWYANDRIARESSEGQRRTAALQQIDDALIEADAMDAQARQATGGAIVRDAAARQAWSACQRAEALFEATSSPPEEWRDRFTTIKTRVAETERATRLAVALDQWRANLFDPRGAFDPAAASRRCHEILVAHGIDVRGGQVEALAAELKAHPAAGTLREALADWLAVTEDATERRHLAAVLAAAGEAVPDAWLTALDAGDPDALSKLADAPPDSPIPAAGVAVVARRLIQADRPAAAEKLLARGVLRYPNDFTLNAQFGTLLRNRPEARTDALRYLTAARAARPSDPGANLDLGLTLADAGLTDEALDVLRVTVAIDPSLAPAHSRIGDLLAAKGQVDASRKSYLTAIQADFVCASAQLGLGRLELNASDLPAAERAFTVAAKSSAYAAAARAGLGRIHLKRWEAAQAVAQFRAAATADPTNVDYRLGLIEALRASNDAAGAVKETRAATKAIPTSAVIHKTLGELLRAAHDGMGAVAAYRAAIQRDPADADTRLRLATLYEELNEPTGATAEYLAVADLRPKDQAVLTALIRVRQKAGDKAGVAAILRRALEHDPADVATRHRLGKLFLELNDESAIEELMHAADARSTAGDIRADLGEALLRFGRFRAAATAFREAADKLPADSPRLEAVRSAARTATRMAGLEDRLGDLLSGTFAPSSPSTWAEVGEVCRRTKRYASAARCFQAATENDEQYAASAAVCAALAGFGQGTDSAGLTDDARAVLRGKALQAFRQSPDAIADPLVAALKDPMFTSALPSGERANWRALWAAAER
jgi:eukaryotic-like serine/threonine-protein kinase